MWKLLKEIPFGETRTYGDLARQLGDVSLAQAVGAANARNPLSVIVPCHRVVGADGSLTGYAGGLDRKRFLLDLEERPSRRRRGCSERRPTFRRGACPERSRFGGPGRPQDRTAFRGDRVLRRRTVRPFDEIVTDSG